MKNTLLLLAFILLGYSAHAQVDSTSTLYKSIKTCDSLLFDIGFNTCNIAQFDSLLSSSFEFYHDKSGITKTKAEFITSIKDGLCKMDYKALRKLIPGSMDVFKMENNGVLYGVIQTGRHRFYALDSKGQLRLTSTARFTHVWLLENGKWKFSRGLSYDHKSEEKE